MSCGNVSSLSLPRSNEKEAAAANRLRSARFWQESSTNAGQDANGPCFPSAMDQKALSTSTSSDGTKLASWRRFFASFLLNMGKRSASTPNGSLWTAPCCKPRRALKKSATEGLGRNPTDRGRSGGKIHLHVDGQGIPLGVTVTGANVHDSRLIEATLKNSREMGGWFLGSAVRHLCLDKGYDYPRVSEEVYVNGFEEHIRSRGEEVRDRWRTPARRWVVERTFAWLKGFRSLRTRYCCYLVNCMGLLYLALACILWRKLVQQDVCRTSSYLKQVEILERFTFFKGETLMLS